VNALHASGAGFVNNASSRPVENKFSSRGVAIRGRLHAPFLEGRALRNGKDHC
jgi:hypothetical protein